MPKRTDLQSILILGSGPIVIGQAAEFDYSGTQAVRALREEGYRVILVNSNPATIMTDPDLADATYIEPITPEWVELVIAKERPDAVLPTMGGQTALNVALELHDSGVLAKYGVELIGAKAKSIRMAEDRSEFAKAMARIGLKVPHGGFATSLDEALRIVEDTGYPAIIRPSFTLGGTGGGIAYNRAEFEGMIRHGLDLSPVHEVLIDRSVIGWKEFELEVMRDHADNVVIICSIENVDAMGVHTGDSVTVAPAQTLTDVEYQKMRDAAIAIIREIGVEAGGCNVQFAVNPKNGEMLIVEMNPRVSRSSALASKATGYPIARIGAKLAVGYSLDELPNAITETTPASFEPVLDYVVVKFPRFAFEKFPAADNTLGVQMKAVGESMAIGRTFRQAWQKAIRALEIGRFGWDAGATLAEDGLQSDDVEAIRAALRRPSPDRYYVMKRALEMGMGIDEVHQLTHIDPWFVAELATLVEAEAKYRALPDVDRTELLRMKRYGFSDVQLARLRGESEDAVRERRWGMGIHPVYNMVDTCAGEFPAATPYLYSTYGEENESVRSDRKKVVILGSGPNRIGQGVEFDYCCVQAALALRDAGVETIMVNSNPETVSTDFDVSDKLYFEPLTLEDVIEIVRLEDPMGVIVQLGGQTPLKLAQPLERLGVPIIGTPVEAIDRAEDRERFEALARELGIQQPPNGLAVSADEAAEIAGRVGYPVLLRPSYVLGGRGMEIVYDEPGLRDYFQRAVAVSHDRPVLIDRFLEDAFEADVDALCDGETVVIGGVMQHIEEAGIHSGDSACVLPPYKLDDRQIAEMREQTKRFALSLGVVGLINVQYAVFEGTVYVIEVNPRASRTVPFVSKATGVPLARIAARLMVGERLADFGLPDEIPVGGIAVKESVFPFNKLPEIDPLLGPEMRSTGEAMGFDDSFGMAFAKAQASAGMDLPRSGRVVITVNDPDKKTITPVARRLADLGFQIMATGGTARYFRQRGIPCEPVYKVGEGRPDLADHIISGSVALLINTPLGKKSQYDDYAVRRAAITYKVPYITTTSAAEAAADAIIALQNRARTVKSIQERTGALAAPATTTIR
ncbi:carbamoyl-phosphate synthase large subunit [Longimicrobium sp.]|uniref:carbamoyl-phosphate synthase large subunit n=1 Tax=Longimicrobium sp. TaxID=2029185 RepID=UPI002C3B6966|nr:carbamoyl-phosphate synthase large subunit [Longimicrobium sp.]HSU12536.1 carbamoyl-phosphate synthase large subunit [Longimicrobium sp.]